MRLGAPGTLPDPKFWAGKHVLLTGHTGFKGAWAALWLRAMGAEVTGFSLEPETNPALSVMANIGADMTSLIGDLRDREAVRSAVRTAKPEIVLHMAAQPIVRRAIADPVETIGANVLGTAHLLDALRDAEGLKAVLVITSDKVYANDELGRPFAEGDRLGGKDPYSASKAAAEMVAQSFRETYFAKAGVALATARGGNVVGGGDYAADRIIPDIVRAVEAGEPLVVRMPQATRPWQHVLDCLAGYFVFAERLAGGDEVPLALNFGPEPGMDATVGALAEAMLAALDSRRGWQHRPVPGSIEMKALAVDAALARATLGWRDRLAGESLIDWTAAWYRAVREGGDARAVTLDQIAAYTSAQFAGSSR